MPPKVSTYEPCVFETFLSHSKDMIPLLNEHIDRLFASAKLLEIVLHKSCTIWAIQNSVGETLKEAAKLQRCRILANSGGWTLETTDFTPKDYSKGVVVEDMVLERPFARAKYTTPIYKAIMKQQSEGVFETLFFDRQEFLREGNITNVFAVFGDAVVTPQERILLGVTRAKAIHIMKKMGLHIEEREIAREELKSADEMFLTNSVRGIVPVRAWSSWKSDTYTVAHEAQRQYISQRNY